MADIVVQRFVEFTSCCQISSNQIIVLGSCLMKVYSLETYQEVKDIPCDDDNFDLLITPDEKMLFVATSSGLKQFSLPDITLLKVHEPQSKGYRLCLLKASNKIIFLDARDLLSIDLNSHEVTEFEESLSNSILAICSTSDEKFIFSSGFDENLTKWSSNSRKVVKSVNLESEGRSLFLKEDSNSLLIGMKNGTLSELLIENLLLIRRVSLHDDWITKIIRLSSGDLITCSGGGFIKFLTREHSQ